MRIAMFYTDIESFNFFVDQLDHEFRSKGHETFIFDMTAPSDESPHSYARFIEFASTKIDLAVCFDGMCVRQDVLIETWDAWETLVVDILMDPPLRFHPTLLRHSKHYRLFCCDRDHVDYVRRYFSKEVLHVDFMPHVGVVSSQDAPVIPYAERKYDILFCGTYYRPQDRLAMLNERLKDRPDIQELYQLMYQNLTADSTLNLEQALLLTLKQKNLAVSEDTLRVLFAYSENVDWAVRMYQRERVITVLANAGFDLYLLGRGWENHSCAQYPNVHRIDDRIPYGETLAYMADAKINLNVFPGFKSGTHDRIFNTLLQHSLPLTDRSSWAEEYFTDGQDIAFYDLLHLDRLPAIARDLLNNPAKAEAMIQKGYEKVLRDLTWKNCADWILDTASGRNFSVTSPDNDKINETKEPSTMKIQLTISLLVSDRMATLGRCLASLKPLLRELDSELIIVYTGSSPDTLELAEQYTPHIIPFTWCNDFAKARNAGLSAARGEWFLYLDDDEWFEDVDEILYFFKSGEYRQYQTAFYIQRNYTDWEGISYADAYVGRMCRLLPETRFVFPIHENIKPYPEPSKKFNTFVHHFGYVGVKNDSQQAEKSDRNLALLVKRLKTEPASAHLYAQAAQEYSSSGEFDTAIEYCRKGLTLAQKTSKPDSLEMWLQLELPALISYTGNQKLALEEGERLLGSPRLLEVGRLNLAVKLVNLCWNLKEYKKGLEFVRQYRQTLEYLWQHSEKAMTQNGITSTFASGEMQAMSVYVKGLFFASEIATGADSAINQILSWIPWEDKSRIEPQYENLDEWKRRYPAQKEAILSGYAGLSSDNFYVTLQKAYYAEELKQHDEIYSFWQLCAGNCPVHFLTPLVEMAVRNGFSLEVLLGRLTLDDWDICARSLAQRTRLPDMDDFCQKLLPGLSESGYPLFTERLIQHFLERQLTQGLLEPSRLLALLNEYCESVIADAKMIYRDELLNDVDSYILPAKYKFAVRIQNALQLLDAQDYAGCVPLLTEALHLCPQLSIAVSGLTKYLNELLKNPPQPASPEFAILGGQVKQMLHGLMANQQWNEAYGVNAQLIALLPDDLEVLRLKQEILSALHSCQVE